MMHVFNRCSPICSVLGAALVTSALPIVSASAVSFGQKQVDQVKSVAIAKPIGQNEHQLLVLEQVTDKKQCW